MLFLLLLEIQSQPMPLELRVLLNVPRDLFSHATAASICSLAKFNKVSCSSTNDFPVPTKSEKDDIIGR